MSGAGSLKRKIASLPGGRKKQRAYYKRMQSGTGTLGIEPNMSGIFISCPKHKERNCIRECYDLLNEYADKLYGVEESSDTANDLPDTLGGVDVEDAVAKELAQMKKPHGKHRFSSIQTGTDCVVFLKTNSPIVPANLVHYMLSDIFNTRQKKTRFTQRLLPIQNTCYANIPAILDLAKQILDPYFHPSTNESKSKFPYAIVARIRNNQKIEKMDLIEKLAAHIGSDHKVDLDNPELVVLVEVFKSICGMSVVRDYQKLKKFNLDNLINDEQDNNSKQSTTNDNDDKAPESTTKETKDNVEVSIDLKKIQGTDGIDETDKVSSNAGGDS